MAHFPNDFGLSGGSHVRLVAWPHVPALRYQFEAPL